MRRKKSAAIAADPDYLTDAERKFVLGIGGPKVVGGRYEAMTMSLASRDFLIVEPCVRATTVDRTTSQWRATVRLTPKGCRVASANP